MITRIEIMMATNFTASMDENVDPLTIISTSPTDIPDPSSDFETHL